MLKNSSNEEIISGIKAAYEGRSPIRPEIAGKIRSEFKRVKTYETSFLYMLNLLASLTVTELDTLYLLSSGHTRADICAIRHVEMSTVKSQIHSILHKFKRNPSPKSLPVRRICTCWNWSLRTGLSKTDDLHPAAHVTVYIPLSLVV